MISLALAIIGCTMARVIAEGTDGVIEFVEYEKGKDQYIHINWSKIPNAADLNWYRVFRSVDGGAFETISTMDLEKGDKVTVLNVYPDTSRKITNGNTRFYDNDKVEIPDLISRSAALKVYMEGGYVDNTSFYIKPAGELTIEGKDISLISVTPMSYPVFKAEQDTLGIMKKYDVVMFGSWDDFVNVGKMEPDASLITNLIKYLDLGYGILIGHDGLTARLAKNEGFNSLAERLNISLGTGKSNSIPNDINKQFEYFSIYVKVSQEGRLTKYPHDLGHVGTIMRVPEAHTGSQWAHENIWFEFIENPEDPEKTRTEPKEKGYSLADGESFDPKGGNCAFYLTTKGNLAFIQTGHSSGESSEDERRILANTIFYLKQKGNNTYVNDFDVYDNAAPEKPKQVGDVVFTPDNAEISLTAEDKGTLYNYYIKGYNPVMFENYTSENIITTITSGIQSFKYVINKEHECTDVSLLDQTIKAEEKSKNLFSTKKNKMILETKKEGSATIRYEFKAGEQYYLHVASVDNKDHISGITTIVINFPSNPPPPRTPTESPEPTPKATPTEIPKQTNIPDGNPSEVKPPGEDTNGGNGGSDNSQNKENSGKGGNEKNTIIGIVVGVVAAAAAAAGAAAAYAFCRPPIAIVPLFGSEEEEEEEEDLEIPANVIFGEEEQVIDPNSQEANQTELDPYENNV